MDRLVQRAGDVVTILVGVVLLIMVASRFFAPDNEPINPVDVHLDTESVGIDLGAALLRRRLQGSLRAA